jgi:hypothetical protein
LAPEDVTGRVNAGYWVILSWFQYDGSIVDEYNAEVEGFVIWAYIEIVSPWLKVPAANVTGDVKVRFISEISSYGTVKLP